MTTLGAHPTRLDLDIHPGDQIDFTVPVLGSDGVAISLVGWTAGATASDANGTVLHDFAPTIASNLIRTQASSAQTRAWLWSAYAARLVITATPAAGSPVEVAVGWIRLYRP
jgi:hypothetical protein